MIHGSKLDPITGKANWKYQLCEILLDPQTDGGRDHYQFAFDILGRRIGFKGAPTGEEPAITQVKWDEVDLPWQGAVHIGSGFFSMELAFPFAAFGARPTGGDTWGIQVGRAGAWEMPGVTWQLAGQTVLAPMPSAFWRNWHEHASLEFVPEALLADYENVGKKTEAINADYFRWRASRAEAMSGVSRLLALTEGKTDLLRERKRDPDNLPLEPEGPRGKAKIVAFGKGRQPTPDSPPAQWNRNWWTNNDGNPRTITCSWATPVTVNLHHIDWLGPGSYGTEYSLEYWDHDGWQLAYTETDNRLPVSCHLFPAVTTDRLRFTVTGMATRDYYLSIQKFEFHNVDTDGKGAGQ